MEQSQQPSQKAQLTVILDCRFGADFTKGPTQRLIEVGRSRAIKILFEKKPRLDLVPSELIMEQLFESYTLPEELYFDIGYENSLSPQT